MKKLRQYVAIYDGEKCEESFKYWSSWNNNSCGNILDAYEEMGKQFKRKFYIKRTMPCA